MYLQQAADAVDYLITDDPRISLGYSAKLDAIIYNPHHPMFARQDWDTAITHDLAHRIDRWFVNSSEKEIFANLFSLEAVGDMEKISFLKRCFPDLMKTFDGLDFALR